MKRDDNNLANLYATRILKENEEFGKELVDAVSGAFASIPDKTEPYNVTKAETPEERENLQNIISALDLPAEFGEDELLEILLTNGFGWAGHNRRKAEKKED
jgi:hypothetical protein